MNFNFKGPMKNVVRCALCVALLAWGCLSFARAYAGTNDDDRGKEAVELRQKIEIERFYAGKGGSAPMAPMAIGLYNDGSNFLRKKNLKWLATR